MSKGGKIAVGIGIMLLLIIAAAWLSDRKLKSLGHPGLRRFAHQVVVNYPKGFAAEPLELKIKVNERDLEHLQRVVEDARARGVIIPEGNEYVQAELEGPDGTFKARIRIKGKLTDHVKGSKWSFRVIAKKNGGFQGMRRFSLQHPGTRNYLYDWFYHKVMEGEGVIALRYGFIRVTFNDDDLGIYAYEEHFGPELLEHNERVAGPLFRFDPGLYWEHRLNEMHKLKLDEPYAEYQAAAVDAYGSGAIAKDENSLRHFEEAVGLIDGFRRGKLTASQVFDADKIARRHAVLDLIGGHHSMDFSDVKFYYDPVAKRVEPVSYESFSAFPIRTLAGSNRYTGEFKESQDLHDAYFNDPDLFRLYVHHLERISRESYLDSIFTVLGPAMDTASAIIYQEFPWKELDRTIFEKNQKVIRRLLDVPKGFHAHAQSSRADTLEIIAVPIEALPLEVHGLRIAGGELIPPVSPTIIPVRMPGRMGVPVPLKFLVRGAGGDTLTDMRIEYSVLGASVPHELEVFPFALNEEIVEASVKASRTVDMRTFPFIRVDEERKLIFIRPGSWSIDKDLSIPHGYEVRGDQPLQIDLQKGAKIISRSPIDLKGAPERSVQIYSSDKSGGSILLIGAKGSSDWEYVELEDLGVAQDSSTTLIFQDSPVNMVSCRLGGNPERDLLQLIRSSFRSAECIFAGGRDQLNSTYSHLHIRNLSAYGAQDDALVIDGGMAELRTSRIENTKGTAVKVNARAEVVAEDINLYDVGRGFEIGEGSSIEWNKGTIRTAGIGVVVEKKAMRYGPVKAELNGLRIEAGEREMKVGQGNEVQVDGSMIENNAHADR